MGTQKAHTIYSISKTYVRSDFQMGTQRAHKGHAKGTRNLLYPNSLCRVRF